MADTTSPKHYFIWGMGLLGASLALDLQKRSHRVSGCVNSAQSLAALRSLGFQDVFLAESNQKNSFLQSADGIIIGTPVDSIIGILKEISLLPLKEDVFITDMASTKADLMSNVEINFQQLPFIGSHPMAGSDHTGPQNARLELFLNATIYVTPSQKMQESIGESSYQKTLNNITGFWRHVGASPQVVDFNQHDQWAAYLSHGLHLVSCMVSHMIKDIPDVFHLNSPPAAGSFRDITRVAGSNPALWDGIISTNRSEVLRYLKSLEKLTHQWRELFEENKLNIKDIFTEAAQIRQKIMHKE